MNGQSTTQETAETEECDSFSSIHTLHHKHYTRDPIYMEWVMAAMVLDRFLLYIFMLVTLIMTITVMVDHPGEFTL